MQCIDYVHQQCFSQLLNFVVEGIYIFQLSAFLYLRIVVRALCVVFRVFLCSCDGKVASSSWRDSNNTGSLLLELCVPLQNHEIVYQGCQAKTTTLDIPKSSQTQ